MWPGTWLRMQMEKGNLQVFINVEGATIQGPVEHVRILERPGHENEQGAIDLRLGAWHAKEAGGIWYGAQHLDPIPRRTFETDQTHYRPELVATFRLEKGGEGKPDRLYFRIGLPSDYEDGIFLMPGDELYLPKEQVELVDVPRSVKK